LLPGDNALSEEIIAGPLTGAAPSEESPTYGQDASATQEWQEACANALGESDWAKIPAAIALAERAMLSRILDLARTPQRTRENRDLQEAIEALSQLKKESVIADIEGFGRAARRSRRSQPGS
jgi:hypothetical protein